MSQLMYDAAFRNVVTKPLSSQIASTQNKQQPYNYTQLPYKI